MEQNRRAFLVSAAAVGGGLALGVSWPGAAAGAPAPATEFFPWLTIGADGVVTVRIGNAELGNGVMTQNLMTVQEELYADWSRMRPEYASAHRNYTQGQVYSREMGRDAFFARSTGPVRLGILLQAGASARERLKEAAAQAWGVPRSEIQVRNGVLTHATTGRQLSYGEVAEKAGTVRMEVEPTPKPRKDWWFMGKANPVKVQQPQIVTGKAVYGIDVQVPDMVYAALMQSPVHGGKLASFDFDKIRGMPGVLGVAVVDPAEQRATVDPKLTPLPMAQSVAQSGIAVIAEHYWQARKALEAMPVQWDDGAGAQWKTQEQLVSALVDAARQAGGKVEVSKGDGGDLIDRQATTVEAVFHAPFAEHAAMEPLNGTALVTADRVDVWQSTQHAQHAHIVAAQEAGVPPEKVHIHQTLVGGGFGRRYHSNDLRMVVAVARKFPGRPVKVIWTREETMRQGRYRPAQSALLRAGLRADGMPVAMQMRCAGTPGMFPRYFTDNPLVAALVPNVQVESRVVPVHVLGGPYRGPGMNVNAFFVETFVDECAVATGMDPLAYRLALYGRWRDAGWTQCLKEVAAKAGWGRKLRKGWGQGIAIANWGNGKPEAGTTVAAVVTVEVTRQGAVRVDAVDIAMDPGTVGYPAGLAAQMEAGAIFALNSALNEQVSIENGRVVEGNFHQYPMLRMADVPKRIGVHFGAVSGHARMHEVGESPMGPVPPALGNAIFAATGKRLRSLPFRTHDLSWA